MSQLLNILASKNKEKKSAAFLDYINSKAAEKRIPLIGHFELTPRCTLNCRMCYVHLDKSTKQFIELKTEEWLSLFDQAIDAGMMYATLSGGECFLRDDFRAIYEYLQSRGVVVSVMTNGTLIDEEKVTWLARRPPKLIQLSVYGSSPVGYARVTGVAEAFKRVDKAIDLLLETNISLRLAVTYSKQMIPDFEATLNYCNSKKGGITGVSPYLVEAREDTSRFSKNYMPSLDEQIALYRIMQKVMRTTGNVYFADEVKCVESLHNNIDFLPEQGTICAAGINKFSIAWNGKMTPCNIFDYAGRYPLEEGFCNSWRFINEKCKQYKNPRECINCESNKYCIAFCTSLFCSPNKLSNSIYIPHLTINYISLVKLS